MVGQVHRLPDLSDGTGPGITEPDEGKYIDYIDPLPDDRLGEVDLGGIGVDGTGIYLRQHPDVMMLDHPKIWAAVDRFQAGFRELREDMHAIDLEASAILLSSHQRFREASQ